MAYGLFLKTNQTPHLAALSLLAVVVRGAPVLSEQHVLREGNMGPHVSTRPIQVSNVLEHSLNNSTCLKLFPAHNRRQQSKCNTKAKRLSQQ